jgi:hypothetical protein
MYCSSDGFFKYLHGFLSIKKTLFSLEGSFSAFNELKKALGCSCTVMLLCVLHFHSGELLIFGLIC